MGYYLDFIVAGGEKQSFPLMVEKMFDAGADMIPLHHDDDQDDAQNECAGYMDLLLPRLPGIVTVFKKETPLHGQWASVRLSWAEDPGTFRKKMRYLLAFAERIGCRLYDGQAAAYVTLASLVDIEKGYARMAAQVMNQLGVASETLMTNGELPLSGCTDQQEH